MDYVIKSSVSHLLYCLSRNAVSELSSTVLILYIGKDRPEQSVKIQIRRRRNVCSGYTLFVTHLAVFFRHINRGKN